MSWILRLWLLIYVFSIYKDLESNHFKDIKFPNCFALKIFLLVFTQYQQLYYSLEEEFETIEVLDREFRLSQWIAYLDILDCSVSFGGL